MIYLHYLLYYSLQIAAAETMASYQQMPQQSSSQPRTGERYSKCVAVAVSAQCPFWFLAYCIA